jgi:hypothetical protein
VRKGKNQTLTTGQSMLAGAIAGNSLSFFKCVCFFIEPCNAGAATAISTNPIWVVNVTAIHMKIAVL